MRLTGRMRSIWQSVTDAVGLAGSLAWLLGDHVRRRLTGRPSWTEELFSDLHFEIDERDVAKPYDSPGDLPVEEARTKQTARVGEVNGSKKSGGKR